MRTTHETIVKLAIMMISWVGGASVLNPSTGLAAEIEGTVKGFDRPLADAVVYIDKIEGKVFPAPEKPVVLDQVKLTFVPHVLPVLAGTKVTFPNNDVTMHNVFSPNKDNRFDLGTYKVGAAKTIVCNRPGVTAVLCHIHHEMSAFIVTTETPYFAVTNPRGEYGITNVPPGQYKLIAWQERMKPQVQEITVSGTNDVTMDFSLKK